MVELVLSQNKGELPPLVTVAMPVYNAGKDLRLAVRSLLRQTFTNWELLIIDDGSTDNALADIAELSDSRIKIRRDGDNKGLAARLNEAIDLARGKYLARMDQDDVAYPERFARQLAALSKDSDLDVVAVRAITIDENNVATGLFPFAPSHAQICARPWQGFYFPHPTWLGKIEWFRRYRYTLPGPYFSEDQELLLRSYRDSKFATLDEILFAYRVRGKVDQLKLAKTRRAVLDAQLRHFSKSNMYHYVLLAIVSFAVRKSSDFLTRFGGGVCRYRPGIVEDSMVFKWDQILAGLATESKVL